MGKHIGEYVKQKRSEANLSQADVAKSIGLASPQFISNIERGIAGIPETKIQAFARALQVPKTTLINEMVEDFKIGLWRAIA